MFWGLFRSRKSSQSSSTPSARPQLETLEDRSVPTVIPAVAASPTMAELITPSTLSNAFAPLTNQLAGEAQLLRNSNQIFAQQITSMLNNSTQLANSPALVGLLNNAFLLQSEETEFATDLALLNFDPFLGSNAQFTSLFNEVVNSIAANPSFLNNGGAFAPGAVNFNGNFNNLLPFLGGTFSTNSLSLGGTTGLGSNLNFFNTAGQGGLAGFNNLNNFGNFNFSSMAGLSNLSGIGLGTTGLVFPQGTTTPLPSLFTLGSLTQFNALLNNSNLGGSQPINGELMNSQTQTFDFTNLPASAYNLPFNFQSLNSASSVVVNYP